MERWTSRKFILACASLGLVALNGFVDLGIDVDKIVNVTMTYIIGEGAVDAVGAWRSGGGPGVH